MDNEEEKKVDVAAGEIGSTAESNPPIQEGSVEESIFQTRCRERWIKAFNYYKIKFKSWVEPLKFNGKDIYFDFYLPNENAYLKISKPYAYDYPDDCPDDLKEMAKNGTNVIYANGDGKFIDPRDDKEHIVLFTREPDKNQYFFYFDFMNNIDKKALKNKNCFVDKMPYWEAITDPSFDERGDFLFSQKELFSNPLSTFPSEYPTATELRWRDTKERISGKYECLTYDILGNVGTLKKLDDLIAKYPNFRDSIEFDAFYRSFFCKPSSSLNRPVYFPHILIVGPSGCGKTSFAKAFAETLTGLPANIVSLSTLPSSIALSGIEFSHQDSKYGIVVQSMIAPTISKSAFPVSNPVIIFDDIDKNMGDNSNCAAHPVIGTMLDREESKNYVDHFLNFPIDASGVNYILTATDISKIPASILNRVNIITVRPYTKEEVVDMVNDVYWKVAKTAAGTRWAIAPSITSEDDKRIAEMADWQPSKLEAAVWNYIPVLIDGRHYQEPAVPSNKSMNSSCKENVRRRRRTNTMLCFSAIIITLAMLYGIYSFVRMRRPSNYNDMIAFDNYISECHDEKDRVSSELDALASYLRLEGRTDITPESLRTAILESGQTVEEFLKAEMSKNFRVK